MALFKQAGRITARTGLAGMPLIARVAAISLFTALSGCGSIIGCSYESHKSDAGGKNTEDTKGAGICMPNGPTFPVTVIQPVIARPLYY